MDYVKIYLKQRRDAEKAFGNTSIRDRTAFDAMHPNITSQAVIDVGNYWTREAQKQQNRLQSIFKSDSAIERQFYRAKDKLGARGMLYFWKTNHLLPEADAAAFWGEVKDLTLAFRGIAETPTAWDMAWEAIEYSARNLLKAGTNWFKVGVFAAIAYFGYQILTRPESGRKL